MSDLPEFPHAELLRPEEGLVHADRKPGMLLDERATDADRVHDGKNAGLAEVARLGSRVIREQAADMRRARQETGWRAGADHTIEFAGGQHVGQRAVFGNGLVIDIRRKLDARPFLASGLLQPAAPPADVARLDAVFIAENPPYPHIGGHL